MIDKLRTAVLKVQWLKPIFVVIAVASIAMFAYVIFGQSGMAKDDYYLLPSVVMLLWSLVACALLFTFVHVPEKPDKSIGFFRRIGIRCKRGYYYILAILSLGTTLAMLLVSFRVVRIWLGDYG